MHISVWRMAASGCSSLQQALNDRRRQQRRIAGTLGRSDHQLVQQVVGVQRRIACKIPA